MGIAFNCCDGKVGAVEVVEEWQGFAPFSSDPHIYLQLDAVQHLDVGGTTYDSTRTFRDGSCLGSMTGDGDAICNDVDNFRSLGPTITTSVISPTHAHTTWTITFGGTLHRLDTDLYLSDPVLVTGPGVVDSACAKTNALWPGTMVSVVQSWFNGVMTGQGNSEMGYHAHRYFCAETLPLDEYGYGWMWCLAECTGGSETCILKRVRLRGYCRKFSTAGLPLAGLTWMGLQRRYAVPEPRFDHGACDPPGCSRGGLGTCDCLPNWGDWAPFFFGDCMLTSVVETVAMNTQVAAWLEANPAP